MIFAARDLDRAEALQMRGDELDVEQPEAAAPQARHEMDECDLARIGDAGGHALAEEDGADMDAVEAADQTVVDPDLDAMRCAAVEQCGIEGDDLVIDPGL